MKQRLTLIVILLATVIFPPPAFCYLMPAFDHEHIVWTQFGPVGIGDMQVAVTAKDSNLVIGDRYVSYVYYGYNHITLPGRAVTWITIFSMIVIAVVAAPIRWFFFRGKRETG
jgi:hypothetical protein